MGTNILLGILLLRRCCDWHLDLLCSKLVSSPISDCTFVSSSVLANVVGLSAWLVGQSLLLIILSTCVHVLSWFLIVFQVCFWIVLCSSKLVLLLNWSCCCLTTKASLGMTRCDITGLLIRWANAILLVCWTSFLTFVDPLLIDGGLRILSAYCVDRWLLELDLFLLNPWEDLLRCLWWSLILAFAVFFGWLAIDPTWCLDLLSNHGRINSSSGWICGSWLLRIWNFLLFAVSWLLLRSLWRASVWCSTSLCSLTGLFDSLLLLLSQFLGLLLSLQPLLFGSLLLRLGWLGLLLQVHAHLAVWTVEGLGVILCYLFLQ